MCIRDRSAIDSIPDPVIIFDPVGGVLNTNQAAESLLGVDPSGTSVDPLGRLEPALRGVLERVRGHVLTGKGSYSPRDFTEALRIESTDGLRYVLPRATPLYGVHGGVQGATVILQDVTRLRRFDELKDDLVATVAHEFRTPLDVYKRQGLGGIVVPFIGIKLIDLILEAMRLV